MGPLCCSVVVVRKQVARTEKEENSLVAAHLFQPRFAANNIECELLDLVAFYWAPKRRRPLILNLKRDVRSKSKSEHSNVQIEERLRSSSRKTTTTTTKSTTTAEQTVRGSKSSQRTQQMQLAVSNKSSLQTCITTYNTTKAFCLFSTTGHLWLCLNLCVPSSWFGALG